MELLELVEVGAARSEEGIRQEVVQMVGAETDQEEVRLDQEVVEMD